MSAVRIAMRSLFLSQRPELVMITSSAQRGPENKLEEEGALNLRERVYCVALLRVVG